MHPKVPRENYHPLAQSITTIFTGVYRAMIRLITRFGESLYRERTSDSIRKNWTFDLSMNRAASGRHVSEANTDRFTLRPQVHHTKPVDNLPQQASISHR